MQMNLVLTQVRELGVEAEDCLALALPEGAELAVAVIAVSAVALCAPLNPALPEEEATRALRDLKARALVVRLGEASPLRDAAISLGLAIFEIRPEVGVAGCFHIMGPAIGARSEAGFHSPNDESLALFTSGTEAHPRLVLLSQRNLAFAAENIRLSLELTAADRSSTVMPLFHIHGLSTVFASLLAGGSVVCAEGSVLEQLPALFAEFSPTWYSAAPAVHRMILDHARKNPEFRQQARLRLLRSASAAMPPGLIAEMEDCFAAPFLEAYGLTEGAPLVATNRLPPFRRKSGSVGQAAGPEITILDGEIAIRGFTVGRYAGAPTRGEGEWLRTGDLGYLDEEGYLFVTGRRKEVINRGGEKFSPREIEAVLLQHPLVSEAAVFAVPHPVLGENVGAAIVLREESPVDEEGVLDSIRSFAAGRLASFKIPQHIKIVKQMPQGSTAKLNRRQVAEELFPTEVKVSHEVFASPAELRLAAIWMEVLGCACPGRQDNFFSLGGHSLAATRAASRIERDFGVSLPMERFFDRPTVAAMASAIESLQLEMQAARVDQRSFPLSSGQRRLWFLDQLDSGSAAYNMQTGIRLLGPLDLSALRHAVNEVCLRHETLRASIRIVEGEPVHVIHDVGAIELSVAAVEDLAAAIGIRDREAALPFRLEDGPLLRAKVLRLHEHDHVLLVTVHHIVSDGWSMGVFRNEVAEAYSAQVEGRKSKLAALPLQFRDFVKLESRPAAVQLQAKNLAYWIRQLEGAPPRSEFPANRPRPGFLTHRGARYRKTLGPDIVEPLRQLSLNTGATLYAIALSAFQILLARCSGQSDVVVGSPIANRRLADLEPLIGFFANTLPMRTRVDAEASFISLLERVRQDSLAALDHQDLPFDQLVDLLGLERDPSRTPLFQVMFAFQNLPAASNIFSGLSVERFETGSEASKFDITLYLTESSEGLEAVWLYNEDLFDRSTIERLDARYQTMLAAVAADPHCLVSRLPFLAASESALLSADRRSEAPAPCPITELFEAHASLRAEHPAIEDSEGSCSYRELNEWANQVARALIATGASRIGLFLPRTCAMVAGALGVWKAGLAYVPLDTCYPVERLKSIVEDAHVSVILSCRSLLPRLQELLESIEPSPTLICLDKSDPKIQQEPAGNLARAVRLSDPAYVIYTSGTTGKPKGVVVTHANLGAYAQVLPAELGIAATDRYLHTASLSFSSSVRQIAIPLAAGATIVIASQAQRQNQEVLFEWIKSKEVTVIDIVPSYWLSCLRLFETLEAERLEMLLDNRLRLLLSASEVLPASTVRQWAALGHPAQIVNMYGQTETTGIVMRHEVTGAGADGEEWIAIGRPIAGTAAWVLDSNACIVPAGVWGELYIGGANVGLGYLDQPGLTAERFIQDPFTPAASRPVYRTGDRARYRADGVIEVFGRLDQQVKIRGYRVEPTEVEFALGLHTDLQEAAVVAIPSHGDFLLAAAVVGRPGVDTQNLAEKCKSFLQQRLPSYMVPARIAVLEVLPRTSSGKLDRAVLAASVSSASGQPASQSGTESTLAQVWRDVLQIDNAGLDDNFFDLGGDSIRSVQIVAEAQKAGLEFTLKDLFQNQTIRSLARVIESKERKADLESSHVRVNVESLRNFGRKALEQAGLDPEGAAIVTEVQLESSLRGQPTHNIADIPRYAKRIAKGVINARPQIRVVRESAVSALVDGDNGPGQWVATVVMETAIAKARQAGIAIVGALHSNHFGAAGQYAWQAAEAGMIGFCTTNGPLILAPTGGIQPTFGNNPIAVGLPAGERLPVVLDIAMSTAPRGRIGLHLAEGRPLEAGWIMDSEGRPSQDLADLAAGLGMPIGGHKGYGLALAMEALSGALTGAGFCWDHEGHRGTPKPGGLDLGHLFIVIDPAIFMPAAEFRSRVDRLILQTKSGKRASGVDEILLPGEQELRARGQSLREGVSLRRSSYEVLCKYAAEAGIDPPQPV
jgi:amino acid adenylation domain-containing protein